jgi:hypothetical protein
MGEPAVATVAAATRCASDAVPWPRFDSPANPPRLNLRTLRAQGRGRPRRRRGDHEWAAAMPARSIRESATRTGRSTIRPRKGSRKSARSATRSRSTRQRAARDAHPGAGRKTVLTSHTSRARVFVSPCRACMVRGRSADRVSAQLPLRLGRWLQALTLSRPGGGVCGEGRLGERQVLNLGSGWQLILASGNEHERVRRRRPHDHVRILTG